MFMYDLSWTTGRRINDLVDQWHGRWVGGTFSDTMALALRIDGYVIGLGNGLGFDFGLEILYHYPSIIFYIYFTS